jgi:hypothetical protein
MAEYRPGRHELPGSLRSRGYARQAIERRSLASNMMAFSSTGQPVFTRWDT